MNREMGTDTTRGKLQEDTKQSYNPQQADMWVHFDDSLDAFIMLVQPKGVAFKRLNISLRHFFVFC